MFEITEMEDLKELLSIIYSACDMAEKIGGEIEGLDTSLRELFKLEALRFLMYLSASDGKVVAAERNFMNELFDQDLSVQSYVKLIESSETYSMDFENTVPLSMKYLALFDAKFDLLGDAIGNKFINLIPVVLDFYKRAGASFICCDGDVDQQEIDDMMAYIAKKEIILKQIVETENIEDYGIVGKKKM